MYKILIVEDDLEMQKLLVDYLRQSGMEVMATDSPNTALEWIKSKGGFHLAVLDIMLPEMDGLELCQKMRKISDIPIIMSSARADISSKILGFERGADDYLAKPFALAEVAARIKALIRRRNDNLNPLLTHGNITFSPHTRIVTQNNLTINLAPKELLLLELLLNNKNKVLSKETIENKLYSWDEDVSSNPIEVHIHHLRRKLGKSFIKTINKIGYILGEE